MSIFDIFKKAKKNTETVQHIGLTLYPGRILVRTYDRAIEGFWIGTVNFLFLDNGVKDEFLGSTIRNFMSLTQARKEKSSDLKVGHTQFLKAAGFKTQKDEYKDAKNIGISRRGDQLTISLSINGEYNGRTRGFWDNGSLKFDNSTSNAEFRTTCARSIGVM